MKKISDKTTIGEARRAGRLGDSELVHLNKAEVKMLEDMTYGHGLTINPKTGEKEAFLPFLLSALPALFPSLGAGLAGATGLGFLANPMVLGAIGSGIGTAVETGDIGKGVMAGLGGAALGGIGGKLMSGASSAASSAANPMAQAMQSGGGVADLARFGAGFMPQMPSPYGLLQAGMVSAPGQMMSANEQMKYRETDDDRRRKERIERAQHENFAAPRQVMRAPDGYRHGFDEEFSFFNPPGTLTGATRRYADGGLVGPQINPGVPTPRPMMPSPMMPVPTGIGGKAWAQPQVSPGLGAWNGLPQRPAPTAPTTPPVTQPPVTRPAPGGGGADTSQPFVIGNGYLPTVIDLVRSGRLGERQRTLTYADGGLVQGPGDGTSDSIPAVINGREPAAISDGEFIIPAAAVAALGKGSTKAGAQRLQQMVDQLLA